MALTLTANIGADDDLIPVTGTVPADVVAGYEFRLGNELLAFQAFDYGSLGMRGPVDPQRWHVLRGLGGTVKATHTAGTTVMGAADTFASAAGVTPPSPWSSGGGGIPQGGPLSADLAAGGFKITGLDDPESAQDAATRAYVLANAGGGGGIVRYRVPIAFDTPNFAVQAFPITGLPAVKTFTVAGDRTAQFPSGANLLVRGSSENDGSYTVDTSSFGAGSTTVVTVEDFVSDEFPDGNLQNIGSAGITLYTPAVGDAILLLYHVVTTGFDGSSPQLMLGYPEDVATFSPRNLDTADNTSGSHFFVTQAIGDFNLGEAESIYYFADTDPLLVRLGNGADGGAASGSTQGAGEVIIVVLTA